MLSIHSPKAEGLALGWSLQLRAASSCGRCRRHSRRACRGCDQHGPQCAIERGPADGFATPTVAPRRWSHSEPLFRIAVEAAGRRIAGVIDGIGDPSVLAERGLGALAPETTRIFRGRNPE